MNFTKREFHNLEKYVNKILNQEPNIKTNWCVITGSPSSGKTTIINELSRLGCRINPDLSRIYLENEIKKGKNKEKVRENEEYLQRIFFLKMLINVSSLPIDELIFHDYALPDNIAFQKMAGIEINPDVWKSARLYRFQEVFLLSPLPFESDEIRTENEIYQQKIDKILEKIYKKLRYDVIRIPALTVKERVDIILSKVKKI